MTVQEIQDIGFEKAVFGGYDMKAVDSFLEEVAENFAAMQKENAALKAKMKVLVDKIEEYRGVEDDMRKTLKSAQTIAQETLDKANAEAEQIRSSAKSQTEDRINNITQEIEQEQEKLAIAKKNTADFISRVSNVYTAQAKVLEELAKKESISIQSAPASSVHKEENATIEQTVSNDVAQIIDDDKNTVDAPIADATRKFSITEDDLSETKKNANFDFGDLKFGEEYDPKEDSK